MQYLTESVRIVITRRLGQFASCSLLSGLILMRLLVILVLTVVLGSCEATTTSTYVPPKTLGGEMCLNNCREAKNYCAQGCDLSQRGCVQVIETQALKDYDKYTRETFAQGGPIDLFPSDFERFGNCTATHDQCLNVCKDELQICYDGCGGTIDRSTSCTFFCY